MLSISGLAATLVTVRDPKATQRSSLDQRQLLQVVGTASVLAIAAFLRLFLLALKPLHHDEGVNGSFLLTLFRQGVYRYNAANYHGPTLYYFALVSSSVNNLLFQSEGPSTWAIRIVPAFFGMGVIGLVFSFDRRLGQVGTLFAAGLLALSPGMVYFSRDFIHEMLLVFFTLWLVVCLARFYDTREAKHLLLASIAVALMFATKETAIVSLAAIAASACLATILVPQTANLALSQFGGWRRLVLLLAASIGLFLLCTVVFFSSFFGNYSQGMHEAVAMYSYWFRTGMTQHKAPWFTYLNWMLREEPVILFSAACGTVFAVFQRRDRFALFAGLWGFGLILAYSILPYKTPWILVNALVPMSLAAGYSVQQLWDAAFAARKTWARSIAITVTAGAFFFTLYQSVQLNFYRYDDDRYVYPYVQTNRRLHDLVQQVQNIADNKGTGKSTSIAITAPEYWPLPWYLRDYKKTGYFGQPVSTTAAIVIASTRQVSELAPLLGERYRLIGEYPLRPGVQLVLYTAIDTVN